MMSKAVIIEDEKKGRIALISMLQKYCNTQITVVGEADSVKSGIEIIRSTEPDVIFLDIHLPDGSGFDLLEKIDVIDFKIIFVTAYDKYAIKAFEFSAVDYLLKPVDPKKLTKAIEKLERSEKLYELDKKLEVLLSNKNGFEKVALPALDGIYLVKISDIIRCESESNYTKIYLNSGKRIMVTKTLKEYDEMLSSLRFFRIHQSHLINLKYVEKYSKGEGGTVLMEDGSEVEVARRRKDKFLSALLNN